jgi:peptidoglycan/LPS O-acetylase OafA/YrhL
MTRLSHNQADEPSYPFFDLLRFVLSSIVVLGHAGMPQITERVGDFAVCAFLALSGWLIGGILLRTQPSGLPRFFFNRGFRIWIPYAASILILYGLTAYREGVGARFFQFLFYEATFTHYWFIPKIPEIQAIAPMKGTNFHYWSISVEEQFYLFAPLVLLFAPGGRKPAFWLALTLLAMWNGPHYSSIAAGVLAVTVKERISNLLMSPSAYGALFLLTAVAFIATVVKGQFYDHFAAIPALGLVLLCARQGARQPLPLFLGGVSYPLYLNHWIGIFAGNIAARVLGLNSVAQLTLCYVLAVGAGIFTYLLIDRPVLRARQTTFTSFRGRAFMIAAYGLLLIGVIAHFAWLPPLLKP